MVNIPLEAQPVGPPYDEIRALAAEANRTGTDAFDLRRTPARPLAYVMALSGCAPQHPDVSLHSDTYCRTAVLLLP